jgi:hypothetical protein
MKLLRLRSGAFREGGFIRNPANSQTQLRKLCLVDPNRVVVLGIFPYNG